MRFSESIAYFFYVSQISNLNSTFREVKMNRWWFFAACLFGGIFGLYAFWRFEDAVSDLGRTVIAFFLFGFYCALVVIGTSGKKRTLSLLMQTLLGISLSCTIAALFSAPADAYLLAVILGLILGFTADWWVNHIQLP